MTANAVEAILPLLPSQQGIYVECQDRPEQYVSQQRIEVGGPVSAPRLEAAWAGTCRAHQALRTSIRRPKGHLVQVVTTEPTAATLQVFDLSGEESADREQIAREVCDEELRRGFDLAGGQLARVALIRLGADRAWLCLTHHHIIIDGRSLWLLLDDIARRYESAEPLASASPSLVAVLRALRLLGHEPPAASVAAPSELTTFAPAYGPPVLHTISASADIAPVQALAARHGLTPASLVIASWLMTVARLRGARAMACAVSRDIRPAQLGGSERAVGMLTQTCMLGATISRSSTIADVARQVQAALTGELPFPPLPAALRSLWQSGAAGRPDTLVTVYTGGSLPPPPAGLRWHLFDAQDTTEFAVDVTMRLTDVIDIDLCFDASRIDGQVADFLIQGTRDFLLDPEAPPRLPAPQHREHPADPAAPAAAAAAPWTLIQLVASRVLSRRVERDENLLVAGADSLALITLVSALREAGWEITIGELMEHGTLDRILPRLRARPKVDLAPRAARSWPPDPSPTESGWLNRTEDPALAADPMHEQSVLGFRRKLDADRFTDAVLTVLARLPSLDRCWAGTDPHRLTYREQFAPHVEVVAVDDGMAVREAVQLVIDADARRPFRPDGSPLMRITLVDGADIAVLVTSFHYAILDGWSFATFVRAIQTAYDTGSGQRMAATDSAAYRAWSSTSSDPEQWADALRGARPLPPVRPAGGPARTTSRPARVPAELADGAARRCGVTASVIVQAAAIEACCTVLGQPPNTAVGLRMSLRDGSPRAGVRTVGQLTADIPILPGRSGLSDLASRVAQAIRLAYGHGHIGEAAFRSLTGCGTSELLVHNVIVAENYYQFDERMLRRVDHAAWPEAFSWRRDVLGAPRVINLREDTRSWAIEIATLLGDDADQLAGAFADRIVHQLQAAVNS